MATGKIIPVMNNSGNGYCKMTDGTAIEWGRTNSGINIPINTVSEVELVYPKAFASDLVIVHVTPETILADKFHISVTNIEPAKCKVYIYNGHSASVSLTFRWIAIGRWK